jgi:predicted aminopeptidase
LPTLRTDTYKKFSAMKLNNARLLVFRTYMQDLEDFDKLYVKIGKDFKKFIDACRGLEKEKDPAGALKKMVAG